MWSIAVILMEYTKDMEAYEITTPIQDNFTMNYTEDHIEATLQEHLLKNHSTNARPVLNFHHAVNISLTMHFTKFKELNTKMEVITVVAVLGMSWTDETLTWDPKR